MTGVSAGLPYHYNPSSNNRSGLHQNKNTQNSKESLSEAIAKYENLADKALKSGNTLAANHDRFMAAVYRSMLDRS